MIDLREIFRGAVKIVKTEDLTTLLATHRLCTRQVCSFYCSTFQMKLSCPKSIPSYPTEEIIYCCNQKFPDWGINNNVKYLKCSFILVTQKKLSTRFINLDANATERIDKKSLSKRSEKSLRNINIS